MSKYTRQNILFALAGIVFLFAGFRDVYFPGFLTLNTSPSSKGEVTIAFVLGLFFIGFAGTRAIRTERKVDSEDQV